MPQSYTPEFKKKVIHLHDEFGTCWLLDRVEIYPNAYYNYWKYRKAGYYAHKDKVKAQIDEIYHEHNGVDGYRGMTVYLSRRSYWC